MSTTSTNDGTASQPEVGRVTKTWSPPPLVSHLSLFVFVHNNPYRNLHSLLFLQGVRPAEGTVHEMEILFNNLPQAITEHLRRHFGSAYQTCVNFIFSLGMYQRLYLQTPVRVLLVGKRYQICRAVIQILVCFLHSLVLMRRLV